MVESVPVLSMEGVSFSFNNVIVLEGVNFTLPDRESIGIVGPNGGGKTTLLKLILGLYVPDTGEIRVFGKPPHSVRSLMGYVPQHLHFDPLFPINALEVVLMGRLGHSSLGNYRRKDIDAARSTLDELELLPVEKKPFASLSGGQRQGVLMARALASDPRILLLDEPTSHVDISREARFLEKLHQLHEKMTIITVSHDLTFVTSKVQQVLCVNKRVLVHPTQALDGDLIKDLYGSNLRLIKHGECMDGSSHCGHRHHE